MSNVNKPQNFMPTKLFVPDDFWWPEGRGTTLWHSVYNKFLITEKKTIYTIYKGEMQFCQ